MRLIIIAAAVVGMTAQSALAFQQTTGGNAGPEAGMAPQGEPALKAPTVEPGKGLNLTIPEMSIGKNTGTEVRIPGLGTVGILPKLDFGLELLYGANEAKGLPDEKSDNNDVQIRGTIKHRF